MDDVFIHFSNINNTGDDVEKENVKSVESWSNRVCDVNFNDQGIFNTGSIFRVMICRGSYIYDTRRYVNILKIIDRSHGLKIMSSFFFFFFRENIKRILKLTSIKLITELNIINRKP